MRVAFALLYDDSGKVLIAQRPTGKSYGGLWEFPGGKAEDKESPEEAVVREVLEELGLIVTAGEVHPPYMFRNDDGELITFYPVTCYCAKIELTLNEHQAAQFVDVEDVFEWPLAPPDQEAVKYLQAP